MRFGLIPVAHSESREESSRREIEYRVSGMPAGEQARIGNLGNNRWCILREKDDSATPRQAEWLGDYKSAGEALNALPAALLAESKT